MSARETIIKCLWMSEWPHQDADTILAALSAAGLVVVPREATREMIHAGNRALSRWRAPAVHSYDAWTAMIAATEETHDEA